MTNSRIVMTLAGTVVAAGLGLGAVAHVASRGSAAETAKPGALLELVPEGASLVGFVDVSAVAESPLPAIFSERVPTPDGSDPLGALRDELGIDPLTDVRSATFSVTEPEAGPGGEDGERVPPRWGIAFTLASEVDRRALSERISKLDGDATEHRGTPIVTLGPGDRSLALALPAGTEALLVGEPELVRAMLDAAAEKRTGPSTGVLADWQEALVPSDSFWVAGKPPRNLGELPAGAALPPIASFALSGRLEEALALTARGRAPSPESARNLADMVRGFVAIGRLDSSMDPSLRALAETVRIEQRDDRVEMSLRVPFSTLELLAQRGAAAGR